MFNDRIGKRFFSLNHKGWHFMILDGFEDTGKNSYVGKADSVQLKWKANNIENSDKVTPIFVSIHIPLIASYVQILYGSLEPNDKSLVITNSKEVLDLFKGHNLKLVL
jgi:3',5'-cyclic-AMP phosphodiesterase